LQKHIAEFGVGDAHFRIFNPFFHRFFIEHIIDGDISSRRPEKFENAYILIEIVIVDHLELEIVSAERFKVFEDLLHLFGDSFFVMPEQFYIEHRPLASLSAWISDHSSSSSDNHHKGVFFLHEIHRRHEADEISELQRIRCRIESAVEFLPSLLVEIKEFLIGELVD